MKKKFILCATIVAMLCTAAGCGGNSVSNKNFGAVNSESITIMDSAGSWESGMKAEDSAEMHYEEHQTEGDKSSLDASVYQSELKIIKSGSMEIESDNFEKTDAFFQERVKEYQGIVAERSIHGRPGYRSGSYTIRIPSASFDDFFYSISGECTVINQRISSEDVTERYVDLETRLEANEKKYARLLVLLEKAETLTDVYSIQNELSNVEYEINSIKGTLNSLSSKISYSTISIWVEESSSATVVDDGSFFSAMKASFVNGWNDFLSNVQNILIILAYALPALILFGFVVFLFIFVVRKLFRKIKAKRNAVKQHLEVNEAEEENELNLNKVNKIN